MCSIFGAIVDTYKTYIASLPMQTLGHSRIRVETVTLSKNSCLLNQ